MCWTSRCCRMCSQKSSEARRAARRTAGTVEISYQVSERRACGGLGFQRSSHRYRSVADPQLALRMRLRELAGVRVGWGYRRLHILLRREGWRVNHKRV